MKEYLDLLKHIRDNGVQSEDRTGTGTLSVFGTQTRYNLEEGFPAVTTKKLYWNGVKHELLWFLAGDTNIKYLLDNNVHIWDDDAYRWYLSTRNHPLNLAEPLNKEEFLEKVKSGNKAYGDLGPVYGAQWRKWIGEKGKFVHDDGTNDVRVGTYDQIASLINDIKANPYSRRHILSAWNVSELNDMALPPCHIMAQFYVRNDKLSCQMYQRSADTFLGVPFNIASYALLTHMIAQVCDLGVGEFIHTIGDAHIYLSHLSAVEKQLSREPLPLPTLELNYDIKDIDDFKSSDMKLLNYTSHDAIKAKLETGL